MGNLLKHQSSSENQDNSTNSHYYYPPKHGRYFGTNFIMGGDKFEMSQPESYLFGENLDLNYLGGKPSPFPYTAPLPNEPMQMLRSLINIRKETIKLINPPSDSKNSNYTLEFVFDSDVNCAITIYFLCKEESTLNGLKYIPKNASYCSETFHYESGIGQLFSQSSYIFNPQNYNAAELNYQILDSKGEYNLSAFYPVVIYCLAEEGDDPKQSHSLIATVEKVYDQLYTIKPIKQKIFVDGLSYLLQEIYGIENKTNKVEKIYEDESDNSFECVICMSDLRDTLILPCRHLCLCNSCANSLRYQANNCPICRVPFKALLQIKAVKRMPGNINSQVILSESLNDVIIDIPPGYETIPLVEALNGINPQFSYLTLKQSIPNDSIELEDEVKKSDSECSTSSKNTAKEKNDDNSNIYKNFDEESVSLTKSSDEYNMKFFYKQKPKYVVASGEDSVSASSSSSSGNIQENVQEKTLLLKTQKSKPNEPNENVKTSQFNECDHNSQVSDLQSTN